MKMKFTFEKKRKMFFNFLYDLLFYIHYIHYIIYIKYNKVFRYIQVIKIRVYNRVY